MRTRVTLTFRSGALEVAPPEQVLLEHAPDAGLAEVKSVVAGYFPGFHRSQCRVLVAQPGGAPACQLVAQTLAELATDGRLVLAVELSGGAAAAAAAPAPPPRQSPAKRRRSPSPQASGAQAPPPATVRTTRSAAAAAGGPPPSPLLQASAALASRSLTRTASFMGLPAAAGGGGSSAGFGLPGMSAIASGAATDWASPAAAAVSPASPYRGSASSSLAAIADSASLLPLHPVNRFARGGPSAPRGCFYSFGRVFPLPELSAPSKPSAAGNAHFRALGLAAAPPCAAGRWPRCSRGGATSKAPRSPTWSGTSITWRSRSW